MARKTFGPRLLWRQVGLIAAIGVLIAFSFGYAGRLIANAELQAQVARLEKEVAAAQARVEHRQALLEYVKSDAYVIRAAHEQLGWTFPDEVAVWLVGQKQEQEQPAAMKTTESKPSWRLWYERFVDR